MRFGNVLLVGVGGFAGAAARYLMSVGISAVTGPAFPWATFIINISGCFAIGFFLTYTMERHAVHEAWRYLFPIGFVGAYTTFSTYAYETLSLVQVGAWKRAVAYVVASTVVGYLAVAVAVWSARRF